MNGNFKKDNAMRASTIFAALAAALTLASCAKELANTPSAPEMKGRTVIVEAQAESSKSVFSTPEDGSYPVVWTANDTQIGVSINGGAIQQIAMTPEIGTQNTIFKIESVPETAQFTVVSPYSAFKAVDGAEGRVSVSIPATQNSSSASTDEAAQVLVAQSEEYSEVPEQITLSFQHAAAYLHLQFSNAELLGGELQSVSFATASTGLVGDFYYKPSDRSFAAGASMGSTVTAVPSTLNDVWMAVAPVDLSGETVTVTITTSLGRLVKSSTWGSGRQLQSGKIYKMPIDMADAERPDDEVYNLVTAASQLNIGDKIVIVSANADEAISTTQKTNNRASVAVTRVGDKVYNPADNVEIIELADGLTAGTFALKATKTVGYMYAGNVLEGGSNILQTRSHLNMQGTWTVEIREDNTAWIVSKGSAYHNTIGYNSTDHLLTAYTGLSSAARHIKVYRLHAAPVVADRFNAVMPTEEINYAAAEVPVYVMGNVSWTATLTGDATFKENGAKSISGSGFQTLTLDVAQNDGTSVKEYEVTVTTEASVSPNSYTLTLTQGTKKASFPIQWSMPSANNVSGVDYAINDYSGSYVYSDTHEGKMSVVRVSTTEKAGNNTTYGARPASETRWNGKHCLLHYGVYKEDYWLFEVYNVDNPAGSYTLDYWMESSDKGPKYFLLEYSIDEGATWTKVPGYQTTSYTSGSYTEDTVEYTYIMPGASSIVQVSQAIVLPAVEGAKTLMFRARVTSASRANGTKMPLNHGATSRVGDHVTISFTPAN